MKLYNSDIFDQFCTIFDRSSAHACRMVRVKQERNYKTDIILCLTSRTTGTSARIPGEDACHRAQLVCFLTPSKRNTEIDALMMRLVA